MRPRKTAPLAIVVALLLGAAAPASSSPRDVDSLHSEAARIESQLNRQGERLSLAQEDFNDATYQRQRLEARLSEIRRDLATAEAQWNELKQQLGQRVRALYKNPGFWAEALLSARSINELARARTLAGSVLVADTDLLYETERARVEMERVADQVSGLRAAALEKERELAEHRSRVEREVRSQRALLGQVRGEISEVMEAQRQRELQEAARRAAEESRVRAAAEQRQAAAPPAAPAAPAAPRGAAPSSDGGSSAPSTGPPPRAPRASAGQALDAARSQLGKRYCWGGTGPDCYDCSGLTQWAWAQAGVSIPRSSRAQYSGLPKVPRDQIQPGDLLFFGNPIHHVGIYEGNGVMIEAPYTGENVRRRSINRSDWAGAARP